MTRPVATDAPVLASKFSAQPPSTRVPAAAAAQRGVRHCAKRVARGWWGLGLAACSSAWACSSALATEPGAHSSPAGAQHTAAAASASATNSEAGSKPQPDPAVSAFGDSTQAPAATPTGPAAAQNNQCPAGMLFIQGDYCSKVEHRCTQQWHSKANNKDVCESFEPWSKCVGTRTPKRFCMDDYPWPNQAGERPEVMNNFYQAQVKCAAVGKRLCTESEWTMACEGPDLKPFPYGYVRDTNKCNGDREWDRPNMSKVAKRDPQELARLWQGVPNGSQPLCVSDYGVHDLPGNNDEVAASETVSNDYRGKFDSVTTGGPWYKGVRNQCRPKIYTHNEGFYYYYLGFRCCSEPDGAPTDPRSPKQIQRGWSFERVETLARFTIATVQEKLALKAQGKCTCDNKDVLCKTLCGTLLGPEAKDVTLGQPTPEPKRDGSGAQTTKPGVGGTQRAD